MFWPTKTKPAPATRNRPCLAVEVLEVREVLYAVSGNAWPHPELITLGFVPDGTVVGANGQGPITSNLHSTFNARFGSAATWQNQILKAAQAWAQQTNLNFAVVSDDGSDIGSGLFQQGDPNQADIRIGGFNFGTSTLAQAYMPAPVNNTSFAGDFQFNTGQTWNNGSQYDLYTVALHEFGHVLGLYHSGVISAAMYGSYSGVKTVLNTDDVNGIRAVTGYDAGDFSSPGYQGARLNDSFDAAASNATSATASNITSAINTITKTGVVQDLNITTTGDIDYYKFTVPAGLGGTLTLKAQSSGLSLLAPTLTLYNSGQTQLATQSASATDFDGTTLTVTASVTAGQTYFIKVTGLNATAFGTGNYALTLGLAGVAAPTAAPPDTLTLNGLTPSAGGGQAIKMDLETQANTFVTGAQDTFVGSAMRATAIDANGNFVVVWTSSGQDGGGKGVYGQRFNASGVKIGSEFRVNTTTAGDQDGATVAMDGAGNFVVTWTSNGQDGSGKGVYFQRFNASGVAQGSETRANTTTTSDQTGAAIAVDAVGNFVVTWRSLESGGTDWNVRGQRFSATGAKVGGEFLVNTTTANSQENSQVSMNASGQFVVVWESNLQDGSGYGIYGQRFDCTGTKVGAEFRVNTFTANNQQEPAVAIDAGGNFVITWLSYGQDGAGYGVYAQRFDAVGTKLGSEFRVNTVTADHQTWSTIAMDGNGNFLITWTSWDLDGTRYNIHGQQYSAGGALIGNQFRVNSTAAGDQKYSSSAMNVNGQAVITWFGQGGGDADGVYFQRYRINGGSGLSNMEAGVPHGYGEEGCGCPDHEAHAHEEESDDGCGCGTCSTAVAVVRTGASGSELDSRPVRNARLDQLGTLLARTGSERTMETRSAVSRWQDLLERVASENPGAGRNDALAALSLSGTDASEEETVAKAAVGECYLSVPATAFWEWVSAV